MTEKFIWSSRNLTSMPMSLEDNVVSLRRDNNMVPILTWHDMKAKMRHCFVPHNYTRSHYVKFTNLKQGIKPVDDYY
jgi:hypothetical protein